MVIASELVYLRPDVKLDALVCRWTAWGQLIAPAQMALNLAYRYLPILRSFVTNPSIHVAASQDPAMTGGNFADLRAADKPLVQALISTTLTQCSPLLQFAEHYRELTAALRERARGASLGDFERSLPPTLAGLVELGYDLAHHPRIRILEELLYESELINTECQELCLHAAPDDQRPFFSNTPLLDRPDRIFLKFPFIDPRTDEISKARLQPQSFSLLAEHLLDGGQDIVAFREFFTTVPPLRNSPAYIGEGVRVRYFGHACVLLQSRHVSILIDPTTAQQRNTTDAQLTLVDLPDHIDYLILSHGHEDHLLPEILLQLRSRVGKVIVPANHCGDLADPSMKLIMQHLGFPAVEALSPLQKILLPDGHLISIPFIGEQGGLDISSKQCVLIELVGHRFVFLVDSVAANPVVHRRIAHLVGKVDVVFVGMECHGAPASWLYGPLMSKSLPRKDDESRRISASNAEEAWSAVHEFGGSQVYVYAMGQEPWVRHLLGLKYEPDSIQITESDRLVARCRAAGIAAERLYGCREMFFGA